MTTQRRNRNRGKAMERATAKAFDGKRVGVLGSEDVQHPLFSIETKSCKKFVGIKWFKQCDLNNKDGKIPMVVAHMTGMHHENDIVMMRRKDIIKFLNGGGHE